MPSVVTLPAYTAHDAHDDGDRGLFAHSLIMSWSIINPIAASVITDISVSDDLLEHHADHVHSDTDSIFGNPWLGHVVQGKDVTAILNVRQLTLLGSAGA